MGHNGSVPRETLTKREQEIVLELLDGGRVNTIAEQFALSPRTVRNHIKSVFGKVNVHSQPELIELGGTDPERLNLTSALNSRSTLTNLPVNSNAQVDALTNTDVAWPACDNQSPIKILSAIS